MHGSNLPSSRHRGFRSGACGCEAVPCRIPAAAWPTVSTMRAWRSLVFATDLEWRNRTHAYETAFMAMCRAPRPADMLIIDAHFAEADKEAFAGWGHSCWEDDLEIAESAGIQRVLLGHHAPNADDKTLLAVEEQVKRLSPGAMLARAGQWLTICD